ncbi:uncharacterized protein N7459_004425 [Penicillium hispanicum]|uniref:uncharacterized protein n=1 Tax=Penicillium hispanicum TaxID=1080232 RepID=UPI0025405678|nr:uncharacterized protein N7459_004425 [Penicillium hispanicum]KAJ5584625.1 hypothetical protein N7459_004425 [Penicillium hispanicum]
MDSQISIRQAFSTKFPRHPEVLFQYQQSYRHIRSNVLSTIEAEVTRCFFEESLQLYASIFSHHFPRIASASALSALMPQSEGTHVLSNEADVLRLSTLQLLHPVNVALRHICPPGSRLICQNEMQGSTNSRFDINWSLLTANGQRDTIAILEVKTTHVIHKGDFDAGKATPENFHVQTARAMQTNEETLLQGNAIWLSKQAQKYAEHCPAVAIFDGKAMFLFDFHLYMRSTRRDEAVRGIYFDESRTNPQQMNFRRLLFAFVARALSRYQA